MNAGSDFWGADVVNRPRHDLEAERNPTWGAYFLSVFSGRRSRIARMNRVEWAAHAAVMRMIRGREA